MKFEVVTTQGYNKSWNKLPKTAQTRVTEKLREIFHSPNPLCFAKKIQGSPFYRFRAGDYRIIFTVYGTAYTLFLVQHRREVYRGL